MSIWKTCLRWAAAVLAPQTCVLCEDWVAEDDLSPLCGDCLLGLPRLSDRRCRRCGVPAAGDILQKSALCAMCRFKPPQFDAARAWGAYEGDLKRLLHAYKFHGLRRLAYPLAGLLEESLKPLGREARPDWLLPVPLHRRRVRQRGFDPPRLLARLLGRSLSLPLYRHVRRVRHTAPQTGLSAVDRRRNLVGAFRVRQPELLKGRKVLLVDDILTTGATANELARTLRQSSQVERIEILTVARVPRWTGAGPQNP